MQFYLGNKMKDKTTRLYLIWKHILKSGKILAGYLVSLFITISIIVNFISILQNSDLTTIETAKKVDVFIRHYHADKNMLPTKTDLQKQFPELTYNNGWYFYTDNRTYLSIQYPVKWKNKNALGKGLISEFTATVYAYKLEYRINVQ